MGRSGFGRYLAVVLVVVVVSSFYPHKHTHTHTTTTPTKDNEVMKYWLIHKTLELKTLNKSPYFYLPI